MKTIALIGTFDTKGEEYLYVKNKIEDLGVRTLTIHAGIFEATFSPDIDHDSVAVLGEGSIVELQEKILKVAASYVKKGGKLLFSTCTVNKDENEAHVKWIQDTLKMTPVSLNGTLPGLVHSPTTQQGFVQLIPGMQDTDGFFISVFEK